MLDPRDALDAVGHLPDPEIDLAETALLFARIDRPEAAWPAARAHLSDLAREAAALDGGGDLASRARDLATLLAVRHGYRGDVATYDDLGNANLITAIERRRGLPVVLGILWLHCARAAGWPAHGVDFPGHLLVAVEGQGQQMVLDVFNGGNALDARDLRVLLKQFEGEDAELRPGLLRPMRAREVLLRLQNNIRLRRLEAGHADQAFTVLQDMLRIAPDAASLWRDAATLAARLNRVGEALRCCERFLSLVPDGPAADRVRATADALRERPG